MRLFRYLVSVLALTVLVSTVSVGYAFFDQSCNCITLDENTMVGLVETPIEIDIGTKTSYTQDMVSLIKDRLGIEDCSKTFQRHNLNILASESLGGFPEPEIDPEDETIEYNKITLSNNKLTVENLTSDSLEFEVNVTLSYGSKKPSGSENSASNDIRVVIKRSTNPITIDVDYDSAEQEINVVLHPNGNSSAILKLDNTEIQSIDFEPGMDGDYRDYRITIPYADTVKPNPVLSDDIKIERFLDSNNKLSLRFTWNPVDDIDNIIGLQAVTEDAQYNSDICEVNIKSDILKYKLTLNTRIAKKNDPTSDIQYIEKERELSVSAIKDENNEIIGYQATTRVIDTSDDNIVAYGEFVPSYIKLSTLDDHNNETSLSPSAIKIINKYLIYNTQGTFNKINYDQDGRLHFTEQNTYPESVNEGSVISLSLSDRDIDKHDSDWLSSGIDSPKIVAAAIVDDNGRIITTGPDSTVKGTLSIVGNDGQTGSGSQEEKTVDLIYVSSVGDPDYIIIKYWYSKVREDVTCDNSNDELGAYSFIKVNVNIQDQIPQAKNDTADDIDYIYSSRNNGKHPEFLSGQSQINIPLYTILANDSDRELTQSKEPAEVTIDEKVEYFNKPGCIETRVSKGSPLGTTVSVDSANKNIVLKLSKTTYGSVSFDYRIRDPKGNWSDWATSSIIVQLAPSEPIALEITKLVENKSNTTTTIDLNIDNPSSIQYEVISGRILKINDKENFDPALGNNIDMKSGYQTRNGFNHYYYRFTIKNENLFKTDNTILYEYTIQYTIGTDTRTSTSTILIKLTDGDNSINEGYLYVHRKPIAQYTPTVEIQTEEDVDYVHSCEIELPNGESSYDLDHENMHSFNAESPRLSFEYLGGERPEYSRQGIRAWEWGVRVQGVNAAPGEFGPWMTGIFDAQGLSYDTKTANTDPAYDGSQIYLKSNELEDDQYVDLARKTGIEWINKKIADTIAGKASESGGASTILVSLRVRDIDNEERLYIEEKNGEWVGASKIPNGYRAPTEQELKSFREYRNSMTEEQLEKTDTYKIYTETRNEGTKKVQYKYFIKKVGVWSEPQVVTLTAKEIKPIAIFNISPKVITVPRTGTINDALVSLTDNSFDPNGSPLTSWKWEITNYDDVSIAGGGLTQYSYNYNIDTVAKWVSDNFVQQARSRSWNPTGDHGNDFKVKLTVTKDAKHPDNSTSATVSMTVKLYLSNDPPVIDTIGNDPIIYTSYEEDKGKDGFVGDNWGTLSSPGVNTHITRPGYPRFDDMFSVKDADSTSLTGKNITMSWQFDGQSVKTRLEWFELGTVIKSLVKTGLAYRSTDSSTKMDSPLAPAETVTDAGFLPGAYKMQVSVTDNPEGNKYQPNSQETTYWQSFGDKSPYHLYVVPSLNIDALASFNGWHMEKDENGVIHWVSDDDPNNKIDTDDFEKLEEIAPTIGDTITIRATTNKYVDELYMSLVDSQNGTNTTPTLRTVPSGATLMTKEGTVGVNGEISWVGEYVIDDTFAGADTGTINLAEAKFTVYGVTKWGGNSGEITREKEVPVSVWVLPIKLYDFRVTEITDPSALSNFSEYVSKLTDKLDNGDKADGALVHRLAAEAQDYSKTSEYNEVKKGYGFYFKLNSKGLKKGDDEIRINVKFYGIDSSGNKVELVGYVPNRVGKYIPYTIEPTNAQDKEYIESTYGLYFEGSRNISLNNHREIIIPAELREMTGNQTEQIWSGRYGIPGDAKFFKVGDNVQLVNEWKGKVLVMFDISAYKNGTSRYNYVERGQWEKERNEMTIGYKNIWKNIENTLKSSKLGAVIVYDGGKSINDNYSSNPVWRE